MNFAARLALAFLEGVVRESGSRVLSRLEELIDERRRRRPPELEQACQSCGREMCCPACGEEKGPR